MIFPSNRVRIMVATKPVDFRQGHDGLAALVKNPKSGQAPIGRHLKIWRSTAWKARDELH